MFSLDFGRKNGKKDWDNSQGDNKRDYCMWRLLREMVALEVSQNKTKQENAQVSRGDICAFFCAYELKQYKIGQKNNKCADIRNILK